MIDKYDADALVRRHWDTWPDASFLSGLPDQDAKDLLRRGKPQAHGEGVTLIREGEPGDSVFLLVHGAVKVFTDRKPGECVLHDIRSSGDVVGEFAFMDGGPRSATVRTSLRDNLVVDVPFAALSEIARERPQIRRGLEVAMGEKARAQMRRHSDGPRSLEIRLARALVELTERHGRETPHGLKLAVGMTQEELGSYISTKRNRVNGVLRRLGRDGVLKTGRRVIIVLDMQRLKELARS
ncbi:Crp/Fnr family transcriptional regulator [Actinomadura sp. SCN-SB]|uniref:Crp/Fnr family transcriptional regulator n=1 Tax=Actinomadura sp. SCN-SB TaxID=3373092 RepID=UPI00375147BD